MKPIGMHDYYVYILTNSLKTVLYIGVTNDLYRRLKEHYQDSKTEKKTFAGKYNCYNLIYYEYFQFINHAIDREKELKAWRRSKKVELVENVNPDWKFLNDEIE